MHGKPYSYKQDFVDKWANYVIAHDDWSALQAKFINAQIENAKQVKLTKEQVEKIRS